jgi:hypothetical protein
MVAMAVSASAAPNVLLNPSFESGPFGDFPYSGVYAPTHWTAGSGNYWTSYTGVYDSTWKNHNCNYPIWPDPLHNAVDGNYFLAKWLPPYDPSETACEYENVHTESNFGHLRQTVTGLTPGATYYFSAWFANNNPHGWQTTWGWEYPMFRVGVLPQEYDSQTQTFSPELAADPTDTLGIVFVPEQRANPEPPPNYLKVPLPGKEFVGSNRQWRKLSGKVTLGPTQNAATFFVEYFTDTNVGYSEAQWVQVDDCRLATTQLLKVENVQFTSFTANSATLEWDVMDGFDRVTGISSANCGVKYGPTAAYGSYVGATEPDPSPCSGSNYGKPGHYRAVISGLTAGQTYHFSIEVKAGTYTYMERYKCPGPPSNPEPVMGTRDYDAYATPDATFLAAPSVTISNVAVTSLTATTANVTWTTNVPADSRVDYGLTTNYDGTASDSNLVTNHSVQLNGLLGHTTYNFKVSSSAPGYNTGSSANSTFTTTNDTQVVNGSFELYASNAGTPVGWKDVPLASGLKLFHTPEWNVSAADGIWYCGMIDNFSITTTGCGIYQQVATTPGQVISLYAKSFADAHGSCVNGLAGDPHRFGEIGNQVGVDPTGALPSMFNRWPNTIKWGEPLQSTRFRDYWNNKCAVSADWRRIAVCAIATTNKATVYLRNWAMYSNGWSRTIFDDVKLEPPTAVSSVSQLKTLPMQTNVVMTPGDFVVTYKSDGGDPNENGGMPYFYIQDTNQSAGVKVTLAADLSMPSWIEPGKKVAITGTYDWGVFRNYTHGRDFAQQLRMDKPCGEPVVRAIALTDAGSGTLPEPVGVTNIGLGGGSSGDAWLTNAGVAGGSGANNVGMRVRVWGKVVEKVSDELNQPVYMVIDDGSALPLNGQGQPKPSLVDQTVPGLYLTWPEASWPMLEDNSREIQVGDYAIITGISAVRTDFDWDDPHPVPDPNDSQINVPEAMKNMRALKIESGRFFASE